jgi:protein-tyrosine kinase
MSRVNEAMRRAAGELPADESTGGPASPAALAGADVATLADEPFPAEIAGRVRPRGPAATPESRPADPADPAAPIPDTTALDDAAPEEAGRLFERVDSSLAEKVVIDENISPVSREQYRRLAAVLHDAQATTGLRVVMVASAVPGEGKTLTAANLALTLSESYHDRVLLIDADLRRPTLHQLFRLKTSSGLIEGLEGKTKLVLRQVSQRLAVLPAGRPTSDPMAALTSERMRLLIDEAKESFDWIILDTPPLVLLPDAHLLSSMVDGAILVVKANSTPHELVKRAADAIGRHRIAGVVLNQAHIQQAGYDAYYSHGYYVTDKDTTGR